MNKLEIAVPRVRDDRGVGYRFDDSEIRNIVTCAARAFAGLESHDERLNLSDVGASGRMFTLDLAPIDVEVPTTSGPALFGTLEGEAMAADFAAPVRRVGSMYGNLMNLTTSSDLTRLVRPVGYAAGAPPVVANPHVSNPEFSAKEYALDAGVPHEVLRNADRDLGTALGRFARSTWMLQREFRVASFVMASANWGSNVVVGSNWSSGGSPITDIYKALAKVKNPRPNCLIVPEQLSQYLGGTNAEKHFLKKWLFDELGISLVIARAKYTSGGAPTDIWTVGGNNVLLCRTVPFDSGELTPVATARWDGDEQAKELAPSTERWVFVENVLLRIHYDPARGGRGFHGCTIACNEDVVMVDASLGCLITGVA